MDTPLSSGPPRRRHRGKDRRPRKKESPYRLTPARRAAGRRNIRKATLARMLEWHPRYTPPEARANSLRALEKANASPAARGNSTRHGLYSALVPAAIERAGESPAEFNAHLERFARAFGGAQIGTRSRCSSETVTQGCPCPSSAGAATSANGRTAALES